MRLQKLYLKAGPHLRLGSNPNLQCYKIIRILRPLIIFEQEKLVKFVQLSRPITGKIHAYVSCKAWFPYRCICRVCSTKKIHRTDITLWKPPVQMLNTKETTDTTRCTR